MKSIGVITNLNISKIEELLRQYVNKHEIPDAVGESIDKAISIAKEQGAFVHKERYEEHRVRTAYKDFYYECRDYRIKKYIEELCIHYQYALNYGQPLEYIYADKNAVLFEVNNTKFALPNEERYIKIKPYKDYSDIPIALIGSGDGLSDLLPITDSAATQNSLKAKMEEKKSDIEKARDAVKKKEDAIKAEIEEMKCEIERKYESALAALKEKTLELEEQKKTLENEIYVLDTQIYGIRCFFGETVKFTHLVKGKDADINAPVILHQKIRFLDEELAKYVALYDVDGSDVGLFEQLISSREDMRELFFPGDKSISLIRISKDAKNYQWETCSSADSRGNVFVSNVLKEYAVYHGKKLGILVRNGENCYIGWTDVERIDIPDGNAFLTPKDTTVTEVEIQKDYFGIEEEVAAKRTEKETVASRYFLFSIMQGLVLNSKLVKLPIGEDIVHADGRYVIYSMADAWIEDNGFGTLDDILEKYNGLLRKGDKVLCMKRISAGGYKYERYSNDRGRGYNNRTHDVYAQNNEIYPVNLIENRDVTYFHYEYDCFNRNDWRYAYTTSDCNSVEEFIIEYEKEHNSKIRNVRMEEKIKQDVFISLEKEKNWRSGKISRANFQLYSDEYMNLTYLNTVLIRSVIINRSIGKEFRGINFSSLLPYLNHALEYLEEREQIEEKLIIQAYGKKLPNEWKLMLSEWKMRNDVHEITEYQAKRFAKQLELENKER